MLHPCSFAKRQ
jgi:hypothetical protein